MGTGARRIKLPLPALRGSTEEWKTVAQGSTTPGVLSELKVKLDRRL